MTSRVSARTSTDVCRGRLSVRLRCARGVREGVSPTLAIFASPHDIGAAEPNPAFDRFDEAMTERQARAVERGVPGARVLRWPRASHHLFLTREADVLEEALAFIASLP